MTKQEKQIARARYLGINTISELNAGDKFKFRRSPDGAEYQIFLKAGTPFNLPYYIVFYNLWNNEKCTAYPLDYDNLVIKL